MDGALGFNTFEKQDKVLVGLNGGMDATVTVRILQEQGFAVQAALVHFAGMADDAVETAQNAAKALDVTLHVIEAADTAADELLKFQLLMQTADKVVRLELMLVISTKQRIVLLLDHLRKTAKFQNTNVKLWLTMKQVIQLLV